MDSIEEARAKAKPGDFIMVLPGPHYGQPINVIIVSPAERMQLSPGWITWERKE